jgi:hypothetical protein
MIVSLPNAFVADLSRATSASVGAAGSMHPSTTSKHICRLSFLRGLIALSTCCSAFKSQSREDGDCRAHLMCGSADPNAFKNVSIFEFSNFSSKSFVVVQEI